MKGSTRANRKMLARFFMIVAFGFGIVWVVTQPSLEAGVATLMLGVGLLLER
jgi:hypothetical protein